MKRFENFREVACDVAALYELPEDVASALLAGAFLFKDRLKTPEFIAVVEQLVERGGVTPAAFKKWWNEKISPVLGHGKILEMSPKRKQKLKARLKEWPDFQERLEQKVKDGRSFLSERRWFNVDFALEPGKVLKLFEGKYDDEGGEAASMPSFEDEVGGPADWELPEFGGSNESVD